MRVIVLLMISALLGLPSGLEAQTRADTLPARPDSVTRAEIGARVAGQEKIRVRTVTGQLELLGAAVSPMGIDYAAERSGESTPGRVPWEAVWEVQVRKSAWLKGATLGGGIMGTLGLLGGLSATQECGGFLPIWCGLDAGDVVALAMVSAASGAAIGALIGAPLKKWHTVYSAEPGVRAAPQVAARRDGGVDVSVALVF